MKKLKALKDPLGEWKRIPTKIRKSIYGLTESELSLKGEGKNGWSIRENVHHLVEANLVATNIIVAALATEGRYYDWTWVNPNKSWMRRVGYDSVRVEPAIKMLRALCEHISALIVDRPQAFSRSVQLSDTTDGPRYVMTVEGILRQEVEHADEHLKMIQAIRERHSR
jgi:hypothetical protein